MSHEVLAEPVYRALQTVEGLRAGIRTGAASAVRSAIGFAVHFIRPFSRRPAEMLDLFIQAPCASGATQIGGIEDQRGDTK